MQVPNQKRDKGILPTPRKTRLSHHRMTLNPVGKPLHVFESSRQFISAIADAMEAHDDTWFKGQILHRDISVNNIIIAENGEGILIDWDLSVKFPKRRTSQKEELQEPKVARRFARTGSWQFISSRLLRSRTAIQDYCDDRESALWVLLWIALQYTRTSSRPGSGRPHDLRSLMKIFNEVDHLTDGSNAGGRLKLSFLQYYSQEPISFTNRPALHSLVETLITTCAIRYDTPPTAINIAALEIVRKSFQEGPEKELVLENIVGYRYQQKMEDLQSEVWLVKTIRDHLAMPGWPVDDKTSRQEMPPMSSTPYIRPFRVYNFL
ncbi:hypothetical protein HYPSUDRAFT_204985 [Hypholoma sublateritium FD-334 SS-4]|uniref:Protein kinase domain-containing protein n=1 Tax=Hypholoma sublateritium (strain FD-334 SS-4) TaxID=945553 RepID=A0A0D2PFG1_HYPSF|nr:hypothetical protein HYPSUDRAFT_204985 [Hypholoma sublateritium FD-334 SS-4]